MTGKTVRLDTKTYEMVLELKGKMEKDNKCYLSMDKAILAACNYVNKNYKSINQSDQIALDL